ncbi:MAG TPA: DUF192 domain-containing protein [Gemmatimonadales bacterium]|nr:DUF192 domain-containing protein [Gemmatimonadales bacterium]
MTRPAPLAVRNIDRQTMLGTRVTLATRWLERARGLLLRPRLGNEEGILIRPCRSVHMFGMTYPIDVAFLDAGGEVVATYPGLRPGRLTRYHRGASAALELPTGVLAASGTQVGDRLSISTHSTRG